jgi:hypothetical protein
LSKEKSLSKLFSSIVELVVLVAGTVSLVLIVDYWIVKWYFESVFEWNSVYTLLTLVTLEGIAFILIGIRFLQEKVEQSRGGALGAPPGAPIIPDVVRIPPMEIVRKARPKLGITLIGAGTVLFILGMFILPNYKL